MDLQFSIEAAVRYGLDEAVFIQSIAFWLRKNAANRANIKDGIVWTYNTRQAMAELFPFWTPRQLDRITASCEEKGLILRAHPDGKTANTWYSLTDTGQQILAITLSPNGDNLSRNGDNLSRNGDNTLYLDNKIYTSNIPEERKENIKEKKNDVKQKSLDILLAVVGEDEELRELVGRFIDLRWKIKKPFKTTSGPNGCANKLREYSDGDPDRMRQIITRTLDNEWLTFYPLREPVKPQPAQTGGFFGEAGAWK